MSNPSLPALRRDRLLTLVRHDGTIEVARAAEQLGVSPITVRRDIAYLAERGEVEQIRGGARLAAGPAEAWRPPAGTAIGVLVPSLDYYWPSVIAGANAAADRLGVRLVLQGSAYRAQDNLERLRRMVDSGSVSGFLIAPDLEGPHSAELADFLLELGRCAVVVERALPWRADHPDGMDSVASDHRSGGAMAAEFLARAGHRVLGLLTDADSPTTAAIRAGWSEAVADGGAGVTSPVAESIHMADPGRIEGIDRFIAQCREAGVTALLVHSDRAALVLIDRLRAAGLELPREMSVITYDDELATLARPALTAVAPSKAELGATAVETLVQRLMRPDRPARRIEICPSVVVRDSTAGLVDESPVS